MRGREEQPQVRDVVVDLVLGHRFSHPPCA